MNTLVWALIALLFLEHTASESLRSKRVINGIPLVGRPKTYKAVRYYGAMGSAHSISWFSLKQDLWNGKFRNGEIVCSGVLIAPIIMQTACHCLASFIEGGRLIIKPPLLNHQWEGKEVAYFGISNRFGPESMVTYNPVLTERYVIHSKCGKILRSQSITHDFGLIQLERDWIKNPGRRKFPFIEMEYAPVKTWKALLSFERYALAHQLVCLHIGFGYYIRGKARVSDVLRHGWEVLMPRPECVSETSEIKGIQPKYVIPHITWVCTRNFSNHEQETGAGDSGGPVTCNNNFVALVSVKTYFTDEEEESENPTDAYDVIGQHSSLLFDPLSSSADYRGSLLQTFYHLPQKYTIPPSRNVLKLNDVNINLLDSEARRCRPRFSATCYITAILLIVISLFNI